MRTSQKRFKPNPRPDEKAEEQKPRNGSQGVVSGSPDSIGGSREGNIGHMNNPNYDQRHR